MKQGQNAITDIVFDLGNVLVAVNWDKAFERLLPHLPARMAEMMTHDLPRFKRLFHGPAIQLETGRIDFTEFHRLMAGILDARLAQGEFRDIWCCVFSMDEAMVSLGKSLSRTYRTWLASNTSRAHYKSIVEKFPDVVFYRAAALSYELGVMKPAARYYRKAMDLFGINAGSALFIDDLPENVEGAIQAGLTGIVFRDRQELLAEFGNLGIELP